MSQLEPHGNPAASLQFFFLLRKWLLQAKSLLLKTKKNIKTALGQRRRVLTGSAGGEVGGERVEGPLKGADAAAAPSGRTQCGRKTAKCFIPELSC